MRRSIVCLIITLLMLSIPLVGCDDSDESSPGEDLISIGQEQYYAIKIADQVVGYHMNRVAEKLQYEGNDVFALESRTVLAGATKEAPLLDYSGMMYLDWNLQPVYSEALFNEGEQKREIEVELDNSLISLTSKTNGETSLTTIDRPAVTLVTDAEFLRYYAPFFPTALGLKPGQTVESSLLVPQTFDLMGAEFAMSDTSVEIMVGEETIEAFSVRVDVMGKPSQWFWISQDGEILKTIPPSQYYTVEIADDGVVTSFAPFDATLYLESKSTESSVRFSSAENVTDMTVVIDARIAGAIPDESFLNTANQSFNGTIEDNTIKGTIVTQATKYGGEDPLPLPIPSDVASELANYLKPAPGIESNDIPVLRRAQSQIEARHDVWEATLAIAGWVNENIEPKFTGAGARRALVDRKGGSQSQTLLTIAMCRAVDIPARLVGGVVYNDGRFVQHYWVEIYTSYEAGWVESDPTLGQFGWVDATHVRLFTDANLVSLGPVEVLEYVDTGEETAARDRLELAVGRQWSYTFFEEGSEFGHNTCVVVAQEERDGTKVYTIESELDLDSSKTCAPTTGDQVLTFDDTGFPISYQVEASIGSG